MRKRKTTIVMELAKLVPDFNIVVKGEVDEANWKTFKQEYKFTSASMAALLREAGEDFLNVKKVKGGRNKDIPDNALRAFNNFIKEKKIVRFEGSAHFNPVTIEPLKIKGWPGAEARMAIRTKAGGRFPFGMIDFRNIPYGSTERAMSGPFYDKFITKFVDYGCPRFREVDIWLWIIETKSQSRCTSLSASCNPISVHKAHYVAASTEGAYTSLMNKKTKNLSLVCLYFVYKAELNVPYHPMSRMKSVFSIQEGTPMCDGLSEESKYANYPAEEFRMEFYLYLLRTLTKRGDNIFNIFGGTKPMYAAMVCYTLNQRSVVVWVDRPKPYFVVLPHAIHKF